MKKAIMAAVAALAIRVIDAKSIRDCEEKPELRSTK
jgi:hypothetical protein